MVAHLQENVDGRSQKPLCLSIDSTEDSLQKKTLCAKIGHQEGNY